MKLTLHEKPFEITDGRILAMFKGVFPHFNPSAKTREGKSMGQQLKWVYMLAKGDDYGKEVITLTHTACGLETAAGKLLMSLADKSIDIGDEIEVDRFAGAYYMITVDNGFVSTKQLPSFVGFKRPNSQSIQQFHDTPDDALGSKGKDADAGPVPF